MKITVADIMTEKNLKKGFNTESALVEDVNVSVSFNITGTGGGSWIISVKNGEISVTENAEQEINGSVTADADVFLDVIKGELNLVSAFTSKRIALNGSMSAIVSLEDVLDFSKAVPDGEEAENIVPVKSSGVSSVPVDISGSKLTAETIIKNLWRAFNHKQSREKGIQMRLEIMITVAGEKAPKVWTALIDKDELHVLQNRCGNTPTATVIIPEDDLIAIVEGKIDIARAIGVERFQIAGNASAVYNLRNVFDLTKIQFEIPSAV